jgi:hypothetical protein
MLKTILEVWEKYGVQIITLITMTFSLPVLNFVRYGKKMKPPLGRSLAIAFTTSIGVGIGTVLAFANGLAMWVDIVLTGFMGAYAVSVLALFAQLDPTLSPLINKLLDILDKDKDGTIDILDPKEKENNK